MHEVQFLSFDGVGDKPKVIGRATFDGEMIKFYCPPSLVESLEGGIQVGSKKLVPGDGLEFMGGLKYAFSGSRFRATGVREV